MRGGKGGRGRGGMNISSGLNSSRVTPGKDLHHEEEQRLDAGNFKTGDSNGLVGSSKTITASKSKKRLLPY